jgi:Ankyrin repeats (3 copies)
MWPEEMAAVVREKLSGIITCNVPWEEIQANLSEGGITGSGKGYTLLHAFVEQGLYFVGEFLLDLAIDVNAKTKEGLLTPLHLAVKSRRESFVRLLLKHKADPYQRDAKEETVLAVATQPGYGGILRTIMSESLHTSESKVTEAEANVKMLKAAIEQEDLKLCDYFLGAVGPDVRYDDGTTPLHLAIQKKNVKMMELLRTKNANFNARTDKGVTILMSAVTTGDLQLVKLVLEKSVNLESKDVNNDTALSMAARFGFADIVEFLVSCDAECVKGYPPNKTPQEVAATFEILRILHRARMAKKKWLQKISRDELEEHYESAKTTHLLGKPPQRYHYQYHDRNG